MLDDDGAGLGADEPVAGPPGLVELLDMAKNRRSSRGRFLLGCGVIPDAEREAPRNNRRTTRCGCSEGDSGLRASKTLQEGGV